MSEFWEISNCGIMWFIRADDVQYIEFEIYSVYKEHYGVITLTMRQSDPIFIFCDTQIDYLNILDQLRSYTGLTEPPDDKPDDFITY